MAKKKNNIQETATQFEEEPNFSDPEDFEDDIADEELLCDLLRQKPKETDGVEAMIIVDGIPQIDGSRLDKLKKVIRKVFEEYGQIVTEYFPCDESGKTKGFIFLEYKDKGSAEMAIQKRNGYKLDKQHSFTVNAFTDFQKYKDVPDKFEEPKPQPYKDLGNLHSFLMDEDCFDQYVVIYDCGATTGSTTAIYSNSVPEPTEVQKRERWTEMCVQWSPRGSYLATFHAKGIALWAGEEFTQIQKFSHPDVQLIDFSPCENYLVTFSSHIDQRLEDPHTIIVWNIRTGQKKRGFHCDRAPAWPVFKWSHDDKYFGRITDEMLSIYETPSFGLLDKKSIKVPGIKDFAWSPTDNVISYWIAETKDVPAKVSLLAIPSRDEMRSKNLFNVAQCNMFWQKSGNHLCVKVSRYAKVKREKNEVRYAGLYSNFEIFTMREKGIPVDSLEIKENFIAFAWEPIGCKFAIISNESPNTTATFYEVRQGQQPTELKKFNQRNWNNIFWSPQGQFVVLGGLQSMSGALDFIDTKDFQIMNSTEHFMATDLEWDPTGRYVTTSVSWLGHKVDNAYWVWNFQGKILRRHPLDRFCQFLWRPRPPPIVTSKDEIKRYMRKYSSQFEIQDKMRLSKASREIIEKRQKLMQSFAEYRKKRQEEFSQEKPRRLQLRSGHDTDTLTSNVNDFDDELVEFFVRSETTIIE